VSFKVKKLRQDNGKISPKARCPQLSITILRGYPGVWMGQMCLHEHAFAAHAERLRTWNIASSLCRLKGVACTWTLIVTSVGRYPSTKLIAAKLNRACPRSRTWRGVHECEIRNSLHLTATRDPCIRCICVSDAHRRCNIASSRSPDFWGKGLHRSCCHR
jgi:hypothetical protein